MRFADAGPRTPARSTLGTIALLVGLLLASACQSGATARPDEATSSDSSGPDGATSSDSSGPDGATSSDSSGTVVELEPLYQPWERVLAAHVDDEGLVDYEALSTRGRADLEEFMRGLAAASPGDMPDEAAQIAFWINAYNAIVLWQVIEAYPIESVRDVGALWGLVGGFFKQQNPIAGENRSLDEIEHGILRANYADARIHWALVCGAFGCPRLLRRPYLAADLDAVLTAQAFEFVAEDRGLRLDREEGNLYLSMYFDWYAEDFEAESESVIDYLLRYATADVAEYLRGNRDSLTIRFMDYDWTLNDQARGPR